MPWISQRVGEPTRKTVSREAFLTAGLSDPQPADMTSRLARRWIGPVLLALATVMVLATPIGADTFPDNYDTRVADSSHHNYCYTSSLSSSSRRAVADYAMFNSLANPTDMSASLVSCTSTTDIWWYDGNLSGSNRGLRTCANAISSSVCNRSNVTLDFAQLDIGSNDWEDRRKTSCHEAGHSVGLDHDSTGCMVTGEVPSTALSWRRYNSHDTGHINAQY